MELRCDADFHSAWLHDRIVDAKDDHARRVKLFNAHATFVCGAVASVRLPGHMTKLKRSCAADPFLVIEGPKCDYNHFTRDGVNSCELAKQDRTSANFVRRRIASAFHTTIQESVAYGDLTMVGYIDATTIVIAYMGAGGVEPREVTLHLSSREIAMQVLSAAMAALWVARLECLHSTVTEEEHNQECAEKLLRLAAL